MYTSLTRHTPIDAWEQCNHTRKTELNRYLVHALEQPPICTAEHEGLVVELLLWVLEPTINFHFLPASPVCAPSRARMRPRLRAVPVHHVIAPSPIAMISPAAFFLPETWGAAVS